MRAGGSGAQTAGTVITRRGGDGKDMKGRVAGLVATAALGLALLAGGMISQARPAARATDPQAAGNPVASATHVADSATLRFLEDNAALATAFVADQGWAIADGTRPGLLEGLPGAGPHGERATSAPATIVIGEAGVIGFYP